MTTESRVDFGLVRRLEIASRRPSNPDADVCKEAAIALASERERRERAEALLRVFAYDHCGIGQMTDEQLTSGATSPDLKKLATSIIQARAALARAGK